MRTYNCFFRFLFSLGTWKLEFNLKNGKKKYLTDELWVACRHCQPTVPFLSKICVEILNGKVALNKF